MSNLGNKDVFANNLKKYMQLNGKSRTEVCQALGFKYSTFADWINGKKYPRMDKIEMLANYFGIPSAFEIAVTVDTFGKAPSISCIFACKEEKASPQKRNILRGKKNILRGKKNILRGKPKPQTRIK